MIWMWEARATPGRLADLRDWAIDALSGREGEVYHSAQSGGDLVVVILRLPDAGPAAAPLPVPPDGLVAGSPHAWPFHQVHPHR